MAAMKIKVRGRKSGTKRRLSREQEQELRRLMIDKTPERLSFKFSLWNRAAVREAVLKRFKVDLPLRTISDYMKRFGFSPHKPKKRAYEQNPEAVKEWPEKVYPAIAEQSRLEGGEIHWGDETGVEAGEYSARGYAPIGQTPTVRLSADAKASRLNMISAITNQGQVRFMIYEEKMTGAVFIKFMGRLIRDSKAKIFLIVDNLKVHHSRAVRDWLSAEDRRRSLEVFYLPLRIVNPQVDNSILKRLIEFSPDPRQEHPLDPSYEHTNTTSVEHNVIEPYANADKVAIFKALQKLESVGLVIPCGEDHMYFAAMKSKSCRLTSIGQHYWRLAHDKIL